jgi:hypothetical protein
MKMQDHNGDGGVEDAGMAREHEPALFVTPEFGILAASGDGTWTFVPDPFFDRPLDFETPITVYRHARQGRFACLVWAKFGWKVNAGRVVGEVDGECLWEVEPHPYTPPLDCLFWCGKAAAATAPDSGGA